MAQQNPLNQPAPNKKRKSDGSSTNAIDSQFQKFIVLCGTDDKPISKISPFAIEKSIQSVAGTVANVTKMRSGNLLIETRTEQQSQNLLKMTKSKHNKLWKNQPDNQSAP